MRKYLNILSVTLLMIYGTVTMVIVPFHHHSEESIALSSRPVSSSTVQSEKSSVAHESKECYVCVFSQINIVFPSAVISCACESFQETQFSVNSDIQSLVFLLSNPHRGPPILHS
jgi:hypothetical protein